MTDKVKTAIRNTIVALQAELDAGKHKGNEANVQAALKAAKDATANDTPPRRR